MVITLDLLKRCLRAVKQSTDYKNGRQFSSDLVLDLERAIKDTEKKDKNPRWLSEAIKFKEEKI